MNTLEGRSIEYRPTAGLDFHNSPLMAEIPAGEYLHRSIDQLRSMNERGAISNLGPLTTIVAHEYKPFNSDLRNNSVTDYTIKANINNNNNLIDNRNTSVNTNINSQSPELEHKHQQQQQQQHHHQQQQQYSSPSTPPTPLSITDAQMNDSKVRRVLFWNSSCVFSFYIALR